MGVVKLRTESAFLNKKIVSIDGQDSAITAME
jgi:hypothetical protein